MGLAEPTSYISLELFYCKTNSFKNTTVRAKKSSTALKNNKNRRGIFSPFVFRMKVRAELDLLEGGDIYSDWSKVNTSSCHIVKNNIHSLSKYFDNHIEDVFCHQTAREEALKIQENKL